ncbi:MAG: sigma-70 family RNA polymerase sigma factor [Microbacteriaceae bacterium]
MSTIASVIDTENSAIAERDSAVTSHSNAAPRTKRPASRAVPISGATTDAVRDYLQQIGRFPLLRADEETVLARAIEVGLLAQEKLATSPDLDPESVRDLKTLAHEGRVANRRFICCNLKLVVSVAKRYSGRGVPLMDLIQEGNLGLDRAVKKFDYQQGFKFSTYAMWWIRQSITRSMADGARLIRVPVHTVEKINKLARIRREIAIELGREATIEELAEESDLECTQVRRLLSVDREPVSLQTPGGDAASELGDLIEDGDIEPVAEIVAISVRNDELHKKMEGLPSREAEILRFRYGLTGTDPMTFEQVGKILGVSRERVRQIESRALKMLRSPELREYLID